MKEVAFKNNIELLMKATNEKNYDLIKEYITPDKDGLLTEMYVSKLLDGNGYQTLRTISRNDNGADVICYNNYNDISKIFQIKNQASKVDSWTIITDFIKVFDNTEYINKPYAYIAINGYSDVSYSKGHYRITKSEILELIKKSKKKVSKELEEKLLDEYYIRLYDFSFIKELIDNYNPMIEQGSISDDEFNSIYKKAIEKYIYDKSKMIFHKEHELLIKAYDERSIKIEYVKALEDIQRCIDNKMNIKPKKTGPSYEETWLKSFNRILTPGQPIKDRFNCNDDSGWIRRQIKSLVEGTLIENRREFLYSVSFIETFINLYYKVKR